MAEEKLPEFKGVKVVKLIGAGSYGAVYEVVHEGKKRALKVYESKMPDLIEIDTLSRIKHPNIIHILEVRNLKDFGIIMPLADMNLHNYLFRKDKDLNTRITILYKIVSAVDFLLDQNILPFDLHSGNVVMMGDEPLIIDTGMARRVDCRGTVLHLSSQNDIMREDLIPLENACGSVEYSEASIVWGLGILAYNILTRGVAYHTPSETKRLNISSDEKYLRWKVNILSSVENIADLFRSRTVSVEDGKQLQLITELGTGMLNPNPERRLSIKDILQHPLFIGQKSLPMGTVVSSDFAVYPEIKLEIRRIVQTMLDDVSIAETAYEQKIPLPSSAIFAAVYAYQRFMTAYKEHEEYKISVPLHLTYNLYGCKQFLGGSILSPGALNTAEIHRILSVSLYAKHMVVWMKGIVHPITDYDKAFTKLSELFPAMKELNVSNCPKPSFRDVAKAILGPVTYTLARKIRTPLNYVLRRYSGSKGKKKLESVWYYAYMGASLDALETLISLFGREIMIPDPDDPYKSYFTDDSSRVSKDTVRILFTLKDSKELNYLPPSKIGDSIISIVVAEKPSADG